jgi:yecA family protein
VWGPTAEDAPTFESDAQAEKIIGLITRHMNAIGWSLHQEPEHFEPVFDLQVYEGDEREYMDGEMWAHGYMTGINMQRDSWKPLFESKQGPVALRPIYLLGAPDDHRGRRRTGKNAGPARGVFKTNPGQRRLDIQILGAATSCGRHRQWQNP